MKPNREYADKRFAEMVHPVRQSDVMSYVTALVHGGVYDEADEVAEMMAACLLCVPGFSTEHAMWCGMSMITYAAKLRAEDVERARESMRTKRRAVARSMRVSNGGTR